MKDQIIHFVVMGCFFLVPFSVTTAQELLNIKEAVAIAIENNYGIQVARQHVEMARNNTDRTLVGYKPSVNALAGANANFGGSTQFKENGDKTSSNNVFTYGGNASVSANYKLLDKSRIYNLSQLQELLKLSDLQLRQTIERNVYQISTQYYNLANLVSNQSVLEEIVELSKQRLQRAQYQFEYGQGTRLNVLNAEVDLQRDSITLINTNQQIENAKRTFNVLLGRDIEQSFILDTSLIYKDHLLLQSFLNKARMNNTGILMQEKSINISKIDLDIIKSEKSPEISSSLSYGYNMQGFPGSATTYSDMRGLSGGLSLGWNIFDGGIRKIRRQNTLLDLHAQDLEMTALLQELETDIRNAWDSYLNALYVLEAEKVSLATNELNFERTQDQYRLGQINSIQFRQAQLNLAHAKTNLNTAKYDVKILEIELFMLSGDLLNGYF